MKKAIATSGGKLFTVTVVGAPACLKDTMVAAHIFAVNLECHFPDAVTLLACLFAHQKQLSGQDLTDGEVRLATRWKKAEAEADKAARPALSNPKKQKFSLVLVRPS